MTRATIELSADLPDGCTAGDFLVYALTAVRAARSALGPGDPFADLNRAGVQAKLVDVGGQISNLQWRYHFVLIDIRDKALRLAARDATSEIYELASVALGKNEVLTTVSHCDGDMEGDPITKVACKARLMSNNEVEGQGCGEPCSWIMRKSGHGKPPFGGS